MNTPYLICLSVLLLQTSKPCYAGFGVLHWLMEKASSADTNVPNTDNIANPCCSFPCQNQGICMTEGFHGYSCDCTETGFYGDHCQYPTFWKKVSLLFHPDPEVLHHILTNYRGFWAVINWVPFLRDAVMKQVYLLRGALVDSPPTFISEHEYTTYDVYSNMSYFTRALPPVPRECPTPMGVWGKKEFPDVDVLVEKFFRRREFRAEKLGSNTLFTFFAQHFTHQFFKSDFKRGAGFTWGGHGVDVSHVYGKDKDSENKLRSFTGGQLKMQKLNGEWWPMLQKDVDVPMMYPPVVPHEIRFAVGHKDFGLLPGLFMYATIWMREHNRACDILARVHPEWDDERLFQTTKLVILGETIKIVITDYVQHLSNYHFNLHFKPELLFGTNHQYQNRIAAEFNDMYHWHPLMPDNFTIGDTFYTVKDFLFRPDLVIKHGMNKFVDGLANTRAGAFTRQNHNINTVPVAKQTILHGRKLRYQPFNHYRKRFGLKPYKTFEELTGESELAKELEELYGDINAVEFYVGIVLEKTRPAAIFGSMIVELGGPFSVKGLMSAPICTPKWWKPSTFGGEVGFNMVKTATLKELFCLNMDGDCSNVSFKVPQHVMDAQHEEL